MFYLAFSYAPCTACPSRLPSRLTGASVRRPPPRPQPPPPPAPRGSAAPSIYIVQAGDSLSKIAARFDVELEALIEANAIEDPASLALGTRLEIPGGDPALNAPEVSATAVAPAPAAAPAPQTRGNLFERMTRTARRAPVNSPYYQTTWLTYYGRPNVDVMGILGEFSIEELIPRMREQADAYDEANGPELGVMPAFHLVYGMATKAPGDDESFLSYLSDEMVMSYIEAAQRENIGVILDVQIGALEPVDAVARAFKWLEYPNVHLAMDPEFAMSHPEQERPGLPIGFVTADEVDAVQHAMRDYMRDNQIGGRRILIVHQFLLSMIQEKETLDRVYKIDLTILADGWGGPPGKVGKYNSFMSDDLKFTGLKLFYRWDVPLMTEGEVLGLDRHPDVAFIGVTPNMIIYQ